MTPRFFGRFFSPVSEVNLLVNRHESAVCGLVDIEIVGMHDFPSLGRVGCVTVAPHAAHWLGNKFDRGDAMLAQTDGSSVFIQFVRGD